MKQWFPCMVLISVFLSSCAFSTQPLSDAAHPLFDHRLKGLWAAAAEEEAVYLHIGVDENNRTQIAFIEQNEKGNLDVNFLAMHPIVIDGEYYANILELDDSGCAESVDQRKYLFFKYTITATGELIVDMINHKEIVEAVESGRLAGEFKEEKIESGESNGKKEQLVMVARYVEVTDAPENIIQFIRSRDPDVLFEKSITFKKIAPGL